MNNDQWKQYFPFNTIRKQQEDAINFVLEQFKTKRYVLLESPVGSGKSAIALTVAKYFKSAYIITPQKILQQQYIKSFNFITKKYLVIVFKQINHYSMIFPLRLKIRSSDLLLIVNVRLRKI